MKHSSKQAGRKHTRLARQKIRQRVKARNPPPKPQQKKPSSGSKLRNFLGQAAAIAGTGIGTYFGQPGYGAMAGKAIQKWITGSGDYLTNFDSVDKNSLKSAGPPIFEGAGRGIRIRKREFLGQVKNGALVSGETSFTNEVHYLNPGLPKTFPWLSGVAHQFEQYKMHGCVFEFVSTYANAVSSTNGAIGAVVLATNYNVLEPNFENLSTALNYDLAEVGKPTQSFLHAIECKPSEEPLKCMFVRDGPLVNDEDLRFSDIGKFQLITQGQQAESTLGELWVSYDVELLKPRVPSMGLTHTLASYLYNDVGVASSDPLGTLSSIQKYGDLGITYEKSGSTVVLSLPEWVGSGYFLVQVGYTCNSAALALPAITATSNCSIQDLYDNRVIHFFAAGSGLTATSMMNNVIFKITGNAPKITIDGSILTLGTSPKVNILITDVSGLLVVNMDKEAEIKKNLRSIVLSIMEEEKEMPFIQPSVSPSHSNFSYEQVRRR